MITKASEHRLERRKHERFSITGRAFVVIGLQNSQKLYHIVDISQGGLAFRYFIENEELEKEHFEVGILSGKNYYAENLPCRSVADHLYKSSGPHAINMMRRSVQFLELSPEQRHEIKLFIHDIMLGQI